MKLYYIPGACSMAPHIVANEIGQKIELEKLDPATGRTEAGTEFSTVNPAGYVPALVLDGGEVLTEGPAIMQYLADGNPETALAPANGTIERTRLQALLNFIGTELHKAFGPLFSEPDLSAERRAQVVSKIERRFGQLERQLADGRTYLTGEAFTIADAYAFVVCSWARVKEIPLEQWPNLQAFVGRVAGRPAVQQALRAEGLA